MDLQGPWRQPYGREIHWVFLLPVVMAWVQGPRLKVSSAEWREYDSLWVSSNSRVCTSTIASKRVWSDGVVR
jgi:hypothetical protein